MKLSIVVTLLYLGISLSWAQIFNSSCPYPNCRCQGETLSCRGLTQLPTLSTPNQFTAFFFDACNIETLSRLPSSYGNAADLVITNSGLSNVADDAFELLDQLETLELNGNRLTVVTKISLSPLRNLMKLDLSYNRFRVLPDELFKDLPKLREIDLGGNQLQLTENLFSGADNLTKLSCNNCHLRDVPTVSLKKIRKLEHLELNENPFESLQDNNFQGLDQILELSLDNCSLSTVHKDALQPFRFLRFLNIGHNKLKSIPMETFKYSWNSLKKLYLESNLFTSLDKDLAPWSSLKELKLGNNPWHCDCNLAWTKDINMSAIDKENVTCVSPSKFQGHSVQEVVSQMSCSGSSSYTMLLGIGISALVLGLTIAIYCLMKVVNRRRRRHRGVTIKYSQIYGETATSFNSKQSLVSA